MGLAFTLFLGAVLGTIFSVLGSGTLAGAAALVTRRVPEGRRKVIIAAAAFPFVCLGWGATLFVLQGIVNEVVLQRDFGLGDTWHAPVSNGYQILMIDDTDQGWVYNTRTQSGSRVVAQEDSAEGVRKAQVAMPSILGATDSQAFERPDGAGSRVDGYFILDTRIGKQRRFQEQAHFETAARAMGIDLKLQPSYAVYSQFRFGWFDGLIVLLLVVAPLVGGVILIRRIVRLRRTVPR
ncbi:MAG: hypothetical protein NTV52_33445 [Acidobacteria bacterium]|nr:hypothetical protein [Acidobacteriota bacterium]